MVRVCKYEDVGEFMADLRARGMQVSMLDDHVAIDPKDLLTPEDRDQIDLWKCDIIDELWKEKRSDPALQHTCARVLEHELTARPGVLEARVWDRKDKWTLQIDFDMSDDRVHETHLEIRTILSKAVQTVYDKSPGRVRVNESAWWLPSHGEPPMYLLSVEGLDLESVMAEAKRLLEELDAFDIDDYIAD